jgi:hypothetical protein
VIKVIDSTLWVAVSNGLQAVPGSGRMGHEISSGRDVLVYAELDGMLKHSFRACAVHGLRHSVEHRQI